VTDEHVKDERVKDAAQDVVEDVTQDLAEDVLGAAENGSVKMFIVQSSSGKDLTPSTCVPPPPLPFGDT